MPQPVKKDAVPPRESPVSRERGVQHIDDDVDAPMDTASHATQTPVNPEGSEEVFANGTGNLSPEAQELATVVAQKIPRRSELVRFREILDSLIGRTGEVAAKNKIPVPQHAGTLPAHREETEKLDHRAAAKLADLEPDELLDYRVRQQHNTLGEGYGPKYLRFVRANGTKGAVEIK